VLGGQDNVRDLVDLWFGPHYRAIGPSRFGYLGSTMPRDATVADQADTFAAPLEHLELERVVMVGSSAGGTATIQFALRHPERLDGLILGSSYLPGMAARPVPPAIHSIVRAVAGWERGWWLLERFHPSLLAASWVYPEDGTPATTPTFSPSGRPCPGCAQAGGYRLRRPRI
jgi:pimeloyl-ACP methyl ester carboxylesterase